MSRAANRRTRKVSKCVAPDVSETKVKPQQEQTRPNSAELSEELDQLAIIMVEEYLRYESANQ